MKDTKKKQEYLAEIEKVIQNGKYQDNWDSLSNYQVPDWYQKLKFGLFLHWGLYSVPAFSNEWYSRNMYIQGSSEFEHHRNVYGEHKNFGYKDFIPLFRAEQFDPAVWAELFLQTGAQYVIPVAEHHDGFQMYRSSISKWNAWEMGPKRDILGELKSEIECKGMTFGASSHRIEHWFFMSHGKEFDSDITDQEQEGDFYWPAMPEPNHQDLFSKPEPSKEFLEDWLIRCCEIVDQYHPKIVYFDWWIQHSAAKPYLKKFAAYYYNRAEENGGCGAVINYKHDAFLFGTAVVDVERGQFAEWKPYPWQTDTAIAKNSWCYTEQNEYKSASSILCDLMDIISKNGRLLLNVGPKADGSFGEQDLQILHEIGFWMKANKEAVYDTTLFRVSGEGPSVIEEGQFTDQKEKKFTPEDIRFTMKGHYLYATVLSYPENGIVKIRSLGEKDASSLPVFHGIIKGVSILGFDETPEWNRTEEALELHTKTVQSSYPVVFKIELD